MKDYRRQYIDGRWVTGGARKDLDVIDPATEKPFATIAFSDKDDVDAAVAAARSAFSSFSMSSVEERLGLLDRIIAVYEARRLDLADAVRLEMGAPVTLANAAQVPSGMRHFEIVRDLLASMSFTEDHGPYTLTREPIGVVGMITPWNWPINQIACKVAPALAAGCTMVLKPSEVAPISAQIFTEVLEEAGVPPGVFNLINGDGPSVGSLLSSHPDIDMVSFTGSTRAGIDVAKMAAPTIKRVTQELGGKSANILLEGIDLSVAIPAAVQGCMNNSGQSCNAPTRLLVHKDALKEASALAADVASGIQVGAPEADSTQVGPVVSEVQWDHIQSLIEAGIQEGASPVAGGAGRPDGLESGYYVQPTVFSNVSNEMRIAREEIFGPVLSIIPYNDQEDAIKIANDTEYGLAAYVSGPDKDEAINVAKHLRAGQVQVNGASLNFNAPFGGYKHSGNGREWGVHGLNEFFETKAIFTD
ncbi:MAG: aldehyde dehydrogenase family protein [Pseudomonadota bacterium]